MSKKSIPRVLLEGGVAALAAGAISIGVVESFSIVDTLAEGGSLADVDYLAALKRAIPFTKLITPLGGLAYVAGHYFEGYDLPTRRPAEQPNNYSSSDT